MDAEQAKAKVRAILEAQSSRATSAVLESVEFPHGWLVRVADESGPRRGGLTFTVDGADGSVRAFPSSIPPGTVTEQYQQLKPGTPALE